MQLEAVKEYGLSIQFIHSPSEAVQLAAVKQNRNAIRFINNLCKSVVDYIELNNK